MSNFKRGKIKPKKTIEYGTPKELQVKHVIDEKVSEPLTKKRYKCKALKGEHDFIRTGAEPVKFMNSDKVFVYYKCRGCFKSKIKTMTRKELQEEIGTKHMQV